MNNTEFNESQEGGFEQGIFPSASEQISTISIPEEDSIVELRIKLEKCEERYNEVKVINEKNHQEIVDLNTRIDQLNQEKNHLIEVIDTKNSEIQQLHNEKEKLVRDIEECHTIAEKLREEIRNLKITISEQTNTIQENEVEIKDLNNKIEVLVRDNKNLEELMKSQKEKHEIEKRELDENLHNCREDHDRIKSELDTCQEALTNWRHEKEILEQTIRELSEKISSIRNFLIKIRDLSSEVNILLDRLQMENYPGSEPQRNLFARQDFSRQLEEGIEPYHSPTEDKPEKSTNDDSPYPWEKGHEEREFIQF